MRRISALGIFAILLMVLIFVLSLPIGVSAGGDYGTTTTHSNDPCDEYHESRHPECQTTTSKGTTTTNSTTSTTEASTTTSTTAATTTTEQVTTTTAATTTTEQATTTTVGVADTTTSVATTVPTVPETSTTAPVTTEETLPFTGTPGTVPLALSAGGLALIGLAMVRRSRALSAMRVE